MSELIPNLIPNANIAQNCSDKPICINATADLKITKPLNTILNSMAPNNVESIGDINIEVVGKDISFTV